jgi:hypothetical protein
LNGLISLNEQYILGLIILKHLSRTAPSLKCYSTQSVTIMTTYAVQRNLPGISMEQLAAAQQAAIAASNKISDEGTQVRYIRSNFYPADSRCTCLFEATDKQAVERANREASLPFDRIEEVYDLAATNH